MADKNTSINIDTNKEFFDIVKMYIQEYYKDEFEDEKPENIFKGDISKVSLAYTDLEFSNGEQYPVQTYANLEERYIDTYIGDKLAHRREYSSNEDFLNALRNLEFNDLVYIEDECVERVLGKGVEIL